jgi:hypothetical protein
VSERGRFDPRDLAILADLISCRLIEHLEAPTTPCFIDAATVARRFGVSAQWVRENAERLGAVRLGDGPRPRLRFDPNRVAEVLNARCRSGESDLAETPAVERVSACRPNNRTGNDPGLLPIRTLKSRSNPTKEVAAHRANGRRSATRSKPSPRPQPTPDQGPAACATGRTPRASTKRSRL